MLGARPQLNYQTARLLVHIEGAVGQLGCVCCLAACNPRYLYPRNNATRHVREVHAAEYREACARQGVDAAIDGEGGLKTRACGTQPTFHVPDRRGWLP
jgi:hypothetical protein